MNLTFISCSAGLPFTPTVERSPAAVFTPAWKLLWTGPLAPHSSNLPWNVPYEYFCRKTCGCKNCRFSWVKGSHRQTRRRRQGNVRNANVEISAAKVPNVDIAAVFTPILVLILTYKKFKFQTWQTITMKFTIFQHNFYLIGEDKRMDLADLVIEEDLL